MARLQGHSGSQSSSDNSPNIILPSQEVMGGCGSHHGGRQGGGGGQHGGGGHQANPPMQVSRSQVESRY